MLNISAEHKKEHLYLEVYHYYRKLILEGRLLPGSKMPSLRKCAQELKLSRTTIENAYLLLAADGYIIARAQSGYYVTGIASKQHLLTPEKQDKDITPCLYDFASSGVDRESFRFDLWQRYIKSALRQGDRMLSYGEPQGESDFREVLADYIRERRNVICSPDDIVVGAGLQPLLQILCPLIHERKTVSFPTPSFTTCSTIFQDYGFDVHYRDKSCDVIYVSPAHMTKWGEIMPVKRRLELIRHAEINDHLIIEDDFENEFVYFPNTGVYMQIVRKGVGTKLQNKETATILCRFIEVNLRGDSIQASNQNSYTTAIPDVMTVSNTLGTFTGSFVSGIMYSYYGASVPSGWLVPLSYVNIGRQETPDEKIAKVRLIVPDSQGQKNASENVYACFYDITYQRGYR